MTGARSGTDMVRVRAPHYHPSRMFLQAAGGDEGHTDCRQHLPIKKGSLSLPFQYPFNVVQLVERLQRSEVVDIEVQNFIAYLAEDRVV